MTPEEDAQVCSRWGCGHARLLHGLLAFTACMEEGCDCPEFRLDTELEHLLDTLAGLPDVAEQQELWTRSWYTADDDYDARRG